MLLERCSKSNFEAGRDSLTQEKLPAFSLFEVCSARRGCHQNQILVFSEGKSFAECVRDVFFQVVWEA